jgi:DNA polymerase-3 subunit alpha
MKFTHLHVHSHYSLLDGLAKIDGLLDKTKSLGMDSLALTDHGVMYGAIEFFQKAKKRGIKPIIGMEAYLAPYGMALRRPKIDEKRYHLTLLAKNRTGYQNLMKMATESHLNGFYYKPRIDKELLKKHSEGLIGMSACINGEVPRLFISGKDKEAEKAAKEYEEIFGKGNFYLEIMEHPNLQGQDLANEKIIELSKKINIPLVATNDVHYLNKEDAEEQDVLLCIQMNKKVQDKDRLTMLGEDYSLKNPEQIIEAFKDIPEAIENTQKIVEQCNLDFEFGKTLLPYFEVPDNKNADEYLAELCCQGLEKRYNLQFAIDDLRQKNPPGPLCKGGKILPNSKCETIINRLKYELDIIQKTGFASYFLIVQDFVNWSKKQGIVVGPGRGSAAGSLTAYLLNITDIDPLKYNLLFERFLNPERISMPDIDLDFADDRRDEVISYVSQKYGDDHVARIITFGTMASRAAVRDSGRALGYAYDFCDQIAKMVLPSVTLGESLEKAIELKKTYEANPDVKKLIKTALKLEGVVRHASTHACGVVITKESIDHYTPRQHPTQNDQTIVTQYEMHSIEDLGLLKIDFLGLKNLTIIQNAINIIKKTKKDEINLSEISLNDPKIFALFQNAKTTGVFQFESNGMKGHLKKLSPTEFEDIIAMVALYRPGPIEWIPEFIARKHKQKKVKYVHPKLEPILKNTYGIAVYQEQILQIARDLAGFTLGEADILRKAVGKKISGLLQEQKAKFVKGAIENGASASVAEKIFSFIEPFAGYGFNRAHAACYALIGYQTAYLKTYYPAEFMAALLTSDQGDMDRIAIEINECQEMKIEVLPPNINESFDNFTVVNDQGKEKIRFGLSAIKNVGHNVIYEIIKERKTNGKYKNLDNFIERVESKDLNKKSLESLIKCGALDEFAERKRMLENSDQILMYSREIKKEKGNGQTSLFGNGKQILPGIKLKDSSPAGKKEKLSWEKELLGLYISDHPLKEYQKIFEKHASPCASLSEEKSGKNVRVGGIVSKIQRIITKSKKPMLFVQLEDLTGRIEVLVFPKYLEENPNVWIEEKVLLVSGKLNDRDGTPKLLCRQAKEINLDNPNAFSSAPEENLSEANLAEMPNQNYSASFPSGENQLRQNSEKSSENSKGDNLYVKLSSNADSKILKKLKEMLSVSEKGNCRVFITIDSNDSEENPQRIETPFQIKYSQSLVDVLEGLVGKDRIEKT